MLWRSEKKNTKQKWIIFKIIPVGVVLSGKEFSDKYYVLKLLYVRNVDLEN
jgi:hypothetical protein